MGKSTELVHTMARKSWWSGKVTALCGVTAEAGTYETSTWRLFGLPGPKCPTCQDLKKTGGGRQ